MENLEGEKTALPESWAGQTLECYKGHSFQLKKEDLEKVKFYRSRNSGMVSVIYLDWIVPCPCCRQPVIFCETTFA